MEVARLLQKKIYVGAAKLQILKHLELRQEIMNWFTANEAESHIHVVPMWTLASFKRMKYLSNQYVVRPSIILNFLRQIGGIIKIPRNQLKFVLNQKSLEEPPDSKHRHLQQSMTDKFLFMDAHSQTLLRTILLRKKIIS